ncbi:MAG: hypothetical protein JNL13_01945, partial [Chitinophagaceae bacterium]|nr:hypothetical protein [Chitinophagaceae bacterium]
EMNKEKIKYYESLEKKISDFNCLDKNTYDYISKLKEIYRTWRSGMFNLDTPELKRIDTVMRYCKQFYTDEFLTTTRPTRGFNLFKAALYDINKINDYVYNQKNIDIFQSASLQYTGNKVMVGAEVASLLVGPVRLGIGGSFESAGDSTDDAVKTSLQKIISNRGTVAINISFPFFYYRSRTNQLHLGVFGQMNNGFNPAIDTVTNKQNFSSFYYTNQSALNFYVDISSNDQKGRVFMEFPLIYSFGAADAYQDLKIADFWMLKTRLGVMINSLIGINITGPLWSSSKKIQSVPFTIGFNFSPSQITKAE